MPLSAPQQTIFDSDSRFRVVSAGRRLGKTYLSVAEMAYAARYPKKRVYYITPTYRMAKQIAWEDLKARLIEKRWIAKVNESDLSVTLVNGSKISLRGSDNPDSLRGITADFIVLDEAAYIDKEVWEMVLRPTLSTTGGGALFITTPCGINNWIYDLYQKGLDPTEEHWESFHFTSVEGGLIPEWEIEQAKNDLDELTFRQEYLADFTSATNLVYHAFNRELNIKPWVPLDAKYVPVLHIGIDFNVNGMAASVFIQEGNIVYAIDEISLLSANTSMLVEEIRRRYPTNKIFAYPDPSGKSRKTSAESGVTDHTILANEGGFIIKAPNKHNPVRDGNNAVNAKLCNAKGERTLFIAPHCKKIIESMEKHTYAENTLLPDKTSGYDHMADSVRYYIDYVFPVRRDREDAPPQRFGVRTA